MILIVHLHQLKDRREIRRFLFPFMLNCTNEQSSRSGSLI